MSVNINTIANIKNKSKKYESDQRVKKLLFSSGFFLLC